jgi:predicted ATP-dependent endonuclease of OLD family
MKISNIIISNFRSVGTNESLELKEIKRFNLFIGENNAGKSNLIRIIPFISDIIKHIPSLTKSVNPSANNSHSNIEDFFNNKNQSVDLTLSLSFTDDEKETLLSGFSGDNQEFKAELFNMHENKISVSIKVDIDGNDKLQFNLMELKWHETPLISKNDSIMRQSSGVFNPKEFNNDYGRFSSVRSGKFNYLWVLLNHFKELRNQLRMIKAVRKIGGTSDKDDGNTASRITNQLDINGARVIDMISDWSSPKNSYSEHRKKYKILNQFISDLLGINIEIVIPHDRSQLLIEPKNIKDGQIMSYRSWGSSVEELIVLVVEILHSPEESIISLEEPEVHLDPLMQRRFINFLKENTNHQYFISSHSSVLINSFTDKSSNIFRVFNKNHTKVEKSDETVLQNVLDDLGVKASDILQTNGIIWVEGPSDRVFINHWINLKNSSLKEGIHYSIMFYGGKLLSHLTAEFNSEQNEEANDFIKLVKLNRNIAIVIDSDKKNDSDTINTTKKRIETEIKQESDRAVIWITDGREIENYIPSEIFESALNIKGMNKYTKISQISSTYVKVDGANKLVKYIDADIFTKDIDLNQKIDELIIKINLWNK